MFSDLRRPTVLCFGEILWDVLLQGRVPGGAPLNVAYYLRQLGMRPLIVSAVGRDAEGDELLRWLARAHLELCGIGSKLDYPTGSVLATIDAGGDAKYRIAADVAWDRIALNEPAIRSASSAHAIVFGSLAQRSLNNRHTLDLLLGMLPVTAERVLDVNLRPPHDDIALVRSLASRATLLKLNAEEAARLCEDTHMNGREETHARMLAAVHDVGTVCITSGENGAGVLDQGEWFWEPAQPVHVRDTIGAGDAFLAALLASRLRGDPTRVSLARACRLGERTASQSGATPHYGTPQQA